MDWWCPESSTHRHSMAVRPTRVNRYGVMVLWFTCRHCYQFNLFYDTRK